MTLYRTDTFKHDDQSTDLKDVLMYEFYIQVNYDCFKGIKKLIKDLPFSEDEFLNAMDEYDELKISRYVDAIIESLNKTFGKKFTTALWLYPLENVKTYYSFNGIDPVIFGYETSDVSLVSYEGEGTLFVYEEMPKIAEEV